MGAILQRLEQKLTKKEILLLPGESFFCHVIPLADDIPDKELDSYAELNLESVSPFPLDHLAWGYVRNSGEKGDSLLLYGAYRDRLRKLDYRNLEDYFHVFPHFLPHLGEVRQKAMVEFVGHGQSLSALVFSAGMAIPDEIVTIALEEEGESVLPSSWFEAREKLIAILEDSSQNHSFDQKVAVIDDYWVGKKGDIVFNYKHYLVGTDSGEVSNPFMLVDSQIWKADVRNPFFKRNQEKARQYASVVWQSLVALFILTISLGVIQSLILLGKGYNAMNLKIIDRQEEVVQYINEKKDMIEQIDKFTLKPIKPFDLLALINEDRPLKLYFTRVFTDEYNILEIRGESEYPDEVELYVDSLKALPYIEDVESETSIIKNRASFRFKIIFNPAEFPAVETELAALPEVEADDI